MVLSVSPFILQDWLQWSFTQNLEVGERLGAEGRVIFAAQ